MFENTMASMKRTSCLLLLVAAAAEALLTLTQCSTLNGTVGSSVPCLNNTADGTTTYLPTSDNQTYTFANLNISSIQDLPPNARWIDLSNNNISQISTRIPSMLIFLNLSHNALKNQWIQTPLTVTTLDVSYNQGGLPWIRSVQWSAYLSTLSRLVFRGNNLTSLRWGFDNFPMDQLTALDLTGNPIVNFVIEQGVYNQLNSVVELTMDPTDMLRDCGGSPYYLRTVQSTPVSYLSDGDAKYMYGVTTSINVCVSIYATNAPTTATTSVGQVPWLITLTGLCGCFSMVIVAFAVIKIKARLHQPDDLYMRGTICSSTCSAYDQDNQAQSAPPQAART
ncbi:hypothetical protein Ae201684_001291 [Aphanomyces euteiches]|uniref:Leucine-rich repeat-containing N-terminal plant-type domain-containing protein n=1 Tax=Aphanomyces euteiches TaxID=100861 RepID=A0A6G0XUB7_9STRA|nr:hypothetical protein Ae201684_001291 [Aphanomyces euteiches]